MANGLWRPSRDSSWLCSSGIRVGRMVRKRLSPEEGFGVYYATVVKRSTKTVLVIIQEVNP